MVVRLRESLRQGRAFGEHGDPRCEETIVAFAAARPPLPLPVTLPMYATNGNVTT